MTRSAPRDDAAVRYLLGDLAEAEQELVEREFLASEAAFDRLVAAEEALIDDYLNDDLSASERARFESHFLAAPRRRRRVEFARALRASIRAPGGERGMRSVPDTGSQAAAPPRGGWTRRATPWIGVAAALVVLGGGAWLIGTAARLSRDVDALGRQQAELRRQRAELERQLALTQERTTELAAELDRERRDRERLEQEIARPVPQRRRLVTVALAVTGLRSGGRPPRIELPADAGWLRVELALEVEDFPAYRAILREGGGAEVQQWDRLRPRPADGASVVSLTLAADRLAAGDYELALQGVRADGGVEDAAYYAFVLARRGPAR